MVDKQKDFKVDYVDVVYNEKNRPFTSYPDKLIEHLINKYKIFSNSKILEIGCGRGEFINSFSKFNKIVYAVDNSKAILKHFPKINFYKVNLEEDRLPFEDDYFDVVFSKSVVEHFYYPDKIIKESYRVLKKKGIIITLTPEWKYIYKSFYEDYTHRTPFTKVSLNDLKLICGFKNIETESFKQLPLIWKNDFLTLFLKTFSFLTRIFLPDYFRMKSKWIRFSKEIMILCKAEK